MQPFPTFNSILYERSFKKYKGSDFTQNVNFNEIVEQYGDLVYRIAITHILDSSSAEDIFQDVFLRLVKNIHKLKNDEHLKFWLIRTTANCCKTQNKRLKFTAPGSPDTEASVIDETLFSDLRMMIEELPQKYRDVVILCCLEGFTADEAAKILKKPVGTIKSQLSRARRLLKEKLED